MICGGTCVVYTRQRRGENTPKKIRFIITRLKMSPSTEFLTMFFLLAGYGYTLHSLRGRLRLIDKKTFEALYVDGKLEMAAMLKMCRLNAQGQPQHTKKAMQMIRLNNFIVFLSFGMALFFLLTEAIKK
jgi:hypothetical protein